MTRAIFGRALLGAIFVSSNASAAPEVFVGEATFLEAVSQFVVAVRREGFEDEAVWGAVRTLPFQEPRTAAAVTVQGLTWSSNHPDSVAPSAITTSEGAAYGGSWALHALPHGNPDANGLIEPLADGLLLSSEQQMQAVGAWFTGTAGGKLLIVIDGQGQAAIEVGPIDSTHRFYGVVSVSPFHAVEFREVEGTVEDQKFLFADEFAIVMGEPGLSADGGMTADADVLSDAAADAQAEPPPDEALLDATGPFDEAQEGVPQDAGTEDGAGYASDSSHDGGGLFSTPGGHPVPREFERAGAGQEQGCACQGGRRSSGAPSLSLVLVAVMAISRRMRDSRTARGGNRAPVRGTPACGSRTVP